MTREQFLDLLRDPSGLDTHREADLAQLVARFPYCQPLQYLHLRKMAEIESVHYPQQLKVTAAFSPDRRQLYHFIHSAGPATPSEAEIIPLELWPETHPVAEDSEPARPNDTTPAEVSDVPAEVDVPAEAATEAPSLASANEILEQRLRELNLWQEEEPGQPTAVAVPEPDASLVLTVSEEEQEEEEEQEDNSRGKSAEAEVETGAPAIQAADEQTFTLPVAHEEEDKFEDGSQGGQDMPAAQQEATDDPLEELIREELLQTRLRNADYFAGQEKQQEEPEVSTQIHSPAGTKTPAMEAAPVPHTSQPETHSFLDWLRQKRGESGTVSVTQTEAESTPNGTHPTPTPDTPGTSPVLSVEPPHADITPADPEKAQAQIPAQSGRNTFNFSTPHTTYVRKSRMSPNPEEDRPAETASRSDLRAGTSHSAGRQVRAENAPIPPAANLSPENEQPQPRKPVAAPESVLNDPPRPRASSTELIEEFIRQEPRITPNKSAFYSPVNMAKKSVQEPEDLVTETLAKVYAGQGNFAKAIQVYEKLRLKFPDKKLYFAALIQELKDKSNP